MKSQDHPLFPPLEDDEDAIAPEVEFIHVTRFEPGASSPLWCSYKFAAEELTDAQQITEMFGGGNYELIARAGSRISARRRYSLAGKSRPLVIGGPSEPETVAVQHVTTPAPADNGMVGMMLQFMQQNAQQAQVQAQSQSQLFLAMMNQTTAMMTAMVNRDAESSKTLLQAMAQNNERALQGQAQVFQAMIESSGKGGGKDAVTMFREGLELGGALRPEPGPSDESMGETIGQVVEGLKMATQLSGGSIPEDLEATG